MITLIVGGARSGKSLVAERLVTTLPPPTTYLATAALDPGDVDFAARVEAHRSRWPTTWATINAGRDLAGPLPQIEGTVLVDALGTWVAAAEGFAVDLDALVDTLSRRQGRTVPSSSAINPPTPKRRPLPACPSPWCTETGCSPPCRRG